MKLPRILITAPSSGSGKTLITCGLLEALKRRGLSVAAFKCGPDYIDPMFHKTVLNLPSKNLDSFLADEDVLKYLFAESAKNADISVIEGVMGYYDGAGFDTTKASTFEIGKIIDVPAILVINAKGMSMSTVAAIKGFLDLEDNSGIKGVILNRVSKMTYMQLAPVIESRLGISVLGFVPNAPDCQLESRHLGLVTPMELDDIKTRICKIADLIEQNVDIDAIIKLACMAGDFSENTDTISCEQFKSKESDNKIKIAVAKDEAFCFYYEDNLRLLEKLGAEIKYFSPLRDCQIPCDCSGIILGGGYPELYAKSLSENKDMLISIKNAFDKKMPIIAECGGFLYLHREIEDLEHNIYEMVGVINAKAVYTGKLSRFGYININLNKNQMYGIEGDVIRGHEFHYYDSDNNGQAADAVKPSGKRQWQCMHADEFFEAGFPHLFYYSNTNFAKRFVDACSKYCDKYK